MKKVSIITLSLVMLMNGSIAFSAPRKVNKRRNASMNMNPTSVNTANSITAVELEAQNAMEELERSIQEENKKEISNLFSTLNANIEKAKSSCSGIKDELKAIQVLAGVSTGASGLGTLTSGGALVTGIMKAKTDKTIEELQAEIDNIKLVEERAKNLSDDPDKLLEQLKAIMPELKADASALEKQIADETKKSKTLGNVRTGLMAGSIATSATSTITSGISTKKLDDLIEKMKDCDSSVATLKSSINNVVAEEIDTDLTSYQNIVKSCSGLDASNIKEIKGVMTASTVVGGIGTATSIAGTITSAFANSNKVRNGEGDEAEKKEKDLNLASNIMAGITTGTSVGGIALGAASLSKLAKNVDIAEKCEDALK